MNLLRENAVHHGTTLLPDAWAVTESLVLLPTKLGVTDQWLTNALACVPDDVRQGRFIMPTSGNP